MAYAALVSLEQTIDKLQHDPNDQYSISLHDRKKFTSTCEYITFLKDFLADFPKKATSLEGRIRDVANEAEDIIEYFMWEQLRLSYTSKLSAGPERVKFPHHPSELFMWLQGKKSSIYTKLRLFFNFKELKKVARKVMEIKNRAPAKDVQLNDSSVATSSSSLTAPTSKGAMVGFDDDLMEIKGRLCGESSKLQVIPIFGMGGIGKTTLARNAYDDPLIVEHFVIHAWVTVSQDYNAQKILSSLLVSMRVEISGQSTESMEEIVYKSLKGKRYLIVMDDMWSTNVWDDVRMVFPNDHNGSRIMLTTRLFDVAAYPDPSSILHELRLMDVDQSWNLLHQKVFAGENCPPELETIGKTISRSCRGLPLAIVVIAGLLSTVSKTQASWAAIAENVNLAINTTNDEQFAKILSLSYTHLPQHLRPCLLYMGAFPKDYEIPATKLIKLWVAEGFLKPSGSKSFEETAEEYLENLVKRSLVMVTKRKSNGKIKSCSIHDLVWDLCIREAREEKFHINVMNRHDGRVLLEKMKNQRRVSIASSDLILLMWLKYICGSMRTIICFIHMFESSLSSFGNFRLLRVLDGVTDNFGLPPAKAFELYHLRYLAFTYTREELVIPRSILNLQYLQTLIIHGTALLPMEIWRMPQLRHLRYIGPLPDIPQGAATFPLENLQTLSGVRCFKCTEEILKMIPNLKKLGILYSGEEGNIGDSHLDNLVHLHQLENLKLEVQMPFHYEKLDPIFPVTLKKLTLSGRILPWEDMSSVGSLPNLQVLKLRNNACFGDKWKTSEGEFSQLKFLLIDESYLMQWITENSHFPSLKCLVLYACWDLKEIPYGIGEIPTLELIEVDDLNESLVDSAKRIQEEQQQNYEDAVLQVRVSK